MSEGTIDVLTNSFEPFWLEVKSPNSLGHTVCMIKSFFQTECKWEGCSFAKVNVDRVMKHQEDCSHRLVKCHKVK